MHITQSLSGLSDRSLRRATRIAAVALVLGVPLVVGFYWLDRHPSPGLPLAERNIAAAEEAVRQSPNDLAARNHLAAAYVSAKRFTDAISQFGQVLDADPGNRAARLGRGLAYLAAAQLDPAKIDAAQVDLARGDFQTFVDAAKAGEFAATDPQLEQAYYELGVVALLQGRPADAVIALSEALKINGGDADALYSLGTALIQTNDAAKGVAALRKAVAFVPSGWCDPYRGLKDGYAATGDTAGTQWAGGMVAACEGRLAEARAALQPLTTGPMQVDALIGLALVSAAAGDTVAAANLYRQVLALEPGNTSASIGLGQLGPVQSPAPQGSPR
ncbi:MAG TPA: tetratricopeptide repeat protein [Candidatus Limnocylindrales bacterium]